MSKIIKQVKTLIRLKTIIYKPESLTPSNLPLEPQIHIKNAHDQIQTLIFEFSNEIIYNHIKIQSHDVPLETLNLVLSCALNHVEIPLQFMSNLPYREKTNSSQNNYRNTFYTNQLILDESFNEQEHILKPLHDYLYKFLCLPDNQTK